MDRWVQPPYCLTHSLGPLKAELDAETLGRLNAASTYSANYGPAKQLPGQGGILTEFQLACVRSYAGEYRRKYASTSYFASRSAQSGRSVQCGGSDWRFSFC